MPETSWIMLSYRIPAEPARRRMAVWRRLKALGAIYLQNGVCLLPVSAEHLRQFRMIEHEIITTGGEAVLLTAAPLDPTQQDRIIERFRAERDEAYREFIERCEGLETEITRETEAGKLTYGELEENDEDLKKLRAWFTKIEAIDFYGAPLAATARERLAACSALLDRFSQQVFDAHQGEPADADAGEPD